MEVVLKKFKDFLKRKKRLKSLLLAIYRQMTKGEIRIAFHFLTSGHLIRWWRVRQWTNKKGPKFLQIGGGRHLKLGQEWLNGDIIEGQIYLNAAKKLPFPDASVDVIFTEHFFEHLSQEAGINFLAEAHKILKPNGVLRQSTPDLDKLISIYLDESDLVSLPEVVKRHMKNHRRGNEYTISNNCQFINDIFRLWGHKYIYDRATLEKITMEAGFRNFSVVHFGKSRFQHLNHLERHVDVEWMKEGFNIIFEATK